MKRSLLLASLMSLASFGAMAVPAFPGPQTAIQPDGSKITYILQGDEFASQMISTDGYLLTRLDDGSICYADRAADGTLHPSIQAHDVRSAAELNFLSNRAKATSLKAPTRPVYTPEKAVVSDNFRGLVILVNYTNQKLCVPNADLFYDQMINTRDFTGYDGQDGNFVEVTGSVRDYFRDNSGGNFDPEFDVVGPVELAVPSSFPMQMQNATQLIILAMNAADPLVDYSNYDSDGDGKIDMVYFIFAGQGSNYTGGSEIWPHKSEILGMQYDGVYTGTYACSAELSGQPNQVQIDGIGTICHEFSHVLGMVDEYDTDYEGSGGEADHPNTWSLMSMGCYTNYGRTPVGYSAYERIQAGFLQPEEITQSGSYSLPDFETSGKAFLINSIVGDEFFILENRQPVKWDKALPGHGMLAYRVDRTDPTLWSTNRVNRNPNHPCYLMLSADPQFGGAFNRREDTEHDTFPGAGNVTELTNTTYPSLQSYYGFNSNVTIHQIAEEDGVISFVADAIPNQSYTEQWSHLFDNAVSGAFKGSIASWTPASGAEIDRDNSRITFIKKSQITSDPIPGKVSLVKFPIYNPTSASAMFQVKYSLDGGNSWKVVNNMAGDDRVSLDANTECVASFSFDEIDLDNNADLQIRVIEFSGVTNQRCSIGDMEFYMVRPSVSVEGLAFMLTEDDYIVATDPKCEVSFFYRGDDTINSVDYSWTLGEAAGTGSYSFPEPLNKDDNSNHVASISLEDVGLVGDYELTMELTAVNGVDLSEPLAAVSPVNVHVIPFMPVKRPLVEEFTGLNCTACPKGYVFMEQMRRDKEDLFVGMAYHSETFENQAINGMVVLHNNDFPVAVQSITSASADRNGISKIDDMTIEWNRAAAEMPIVAVDADLSLDPDNADLLHAQAVASFIKDLDDTDFAISIALVADNMSDPLWKQRNGYSGSSNPDLTGDLWEIFTQGPEFVEGLIFNDVVVAYPDTQGIDNSIPSNIVAADDYTASLDFYISEIKNIWGQNFLCLDAKLRVVAMVIDRNSGMILNAISSDYVDMNQSGVSSIDADHRVISQECFDLWGNRISVDAPGVRIFKQQLSDGSIRIYKSIKY